jgi:pimeloyl-ACP methyl ester carboxylesterase
VTPVRTADGLDLHVETHGEGPAVIFSCAFSTTHENWRGQVDPLVRAGYRAVLWDFRAHGLSQAPSDEAGFAFDRVVADLAAVVRATSANRPVVLAGLSFGGLVSLHLALRDPSLVKALVLVGSGPGFKQAQAKADWAAQTEKTAGFILAKGCTEYVSRAAATCVGRKPELPVAKTAAAAIAAQDPQGLARFARGVVADVPSVIDDLAAIEQPVLVVVGSEDRAFLRAAEVMAAKLPDARHEVLAGAGHIANIEVASEFDAVLSDFLATLD